MPIDMMIEAMKVAYTKSKSRHSMASLLIKSSSLHRDSQLGLLDLPSFHSTQYQAIPGLSAETLRVDTNKDFSISFFVKFYGSGTIRHYSDFGGSQMLMDRFVSKQYKFANNLRHFAKKNSNKHSRCILVFTAHEMHIFSDKQVSTDKIPLDQVYAVHPHPTKGRVFGILADHLSSGTVHCFCFATTNANTNTEVLCGFREACMHWLSRNLSRETNLEQKEENKTEKEKEQLSEEDIQSVDTYLASLFSFTGLCEKKSEINLSKKSLESGCGGTEGQSSSRKVSFASTRCLDKVAQPKEENCGYPKCKHKETNSSGDESSICSENNSKCKMYQMEPRLPPRFFPPPSPPSEKSHCTGSPATFSVDSISDLTSLEDSLSQHVKKELWELKLLEEGYKNNTPSTLSPNPSETFQLSSFSESDKNDCAKSTSDAAIMPLYQSTPESEISTGATMTSEYFTPFQSFHDCPHGKCPVTHDEDRNNSSCSSSLDSYSIRSTSSAPSFLICSSTQLCQCLMDDSTIGDFKAYLQKMCEEDKDDVHTPDTLKSPKPCNEKAGSLGSFPFGFLPQENLDTDHALESDIKDSSDEDEPGEIPSTSEVDIQSESEDSTDNRMYRDIALCELLERLYPVVNASLQSGRESEVCSPQGGEDNRCSIVDLSDGYTAVEPLIPSIDKSHASGTSSTCTCTSKTIQSSHFNMDDPTSKTYSVTNNDHGKELIPPLPLDSLLDQSLYSNVNGSQMDDNKHESLELPLESQKDSSSVCKTYSINDDEDSVLNTPTLLEESIHYDTQDESETDLRIASISDNTEESYATVPLYPKKRSCDEDGIVKSQTTSVELDGGSQFTFLSIPQQGSSEYYLAECLTASNSTSRNNPHDSSMTIPSLPLKEDSDQNMGENEPYCTFKTSISSNETKDSIFTLPSLPLICISDEDLDSNSTTSKISTPKAASGSIMTILSSPLRNASEQNIRDSEPAFKTSSSAETKDSTFTIPSLPLLSTCNEHLGSDSATTKMSGSEAANNPSDSIMTIPSLPLKDASDQNICGYEPTFNTSCSSDTKDSIFTIPSLPLRSVCADHLSSNSATTKISSSEAVTDSNISFPSQMVDSSVEDKSNTSSKITCTTDSNNISCASAAVPSLSLKIKAWSSSDENSCSNHTHKTYSTPANLGSTSAANTNAVAITVMKPPKLVCEGPNAKFSEAELKRNSGSGVNSSLKYVTEFLESSHDSLAKSVHSLCRRAIIKQSNISLELVLPVKDLSQLEKDGGTLPNRLESHLAKLQLNSSTVYTAEKQDKVGKESARFIDEGVVDD